jgi:integrase
MMIRVRQGKGRHDRDVPLSDKLLAVLREYWRWKKPKTYLFPSDYEKRLGQPVSDKVIWWLCKKAAREAGIKKRVSPHTLRHASAYYTTFQSLFILKAIAIGQTQSAAVYGRTGRLARVSARLVVRGPFDR